MRVHASLSRSMKSQRSYATAGYATKPNLPTRKSLSNHIILDLYAAALYTRQSMAITSAHLISRRTTFIAPQRIDMSRRMSREFTDTARQCTVISFNDPGSATVVRNRV
jgi:hypothetical protein